MFSSFLVTNPCYCCSSEDCLDLDKEKGDKPWEDTQVSATEGCYPTSTTLRYKLSYEHLYDVFCLDVMVIQLSG
jgi:hypothetical protein